MGLVNPKRITTFKRTRSYCEEDFELLKTWISGFTEAYTACHVIAEVSNLTDLNGEERSMARLVTRELLTQLIEPSISSTEAAQEDLYQRLGITDGAIARLARLHECTVLTDDHDLYVALAQRAIPVINFTHLRAAAGIV